MKCFSVAIGERYIDNVIKGLSQRLPRAEQRARAVVLVNSERLRANLQQAWSENHQGIRPKFVSFEAYLQELAPHFQFSEQNLLSDILEIAQLLEALLENEPGLFAPSARFRIAFALYELLSDLNEIPVEPEELHALDMSQYSEHWQIYQQFFAVLAQYWKTAKAESLSAQRFAILKEIENLWKIASPQAEIFIVGSTLSRPIMQEFALMASQYCPLNIIFASGPLGEIAPYWEQVENVQDHPFSAMLHFAKNHVSHIENWLEPESEGALTPVENPNAPLSKSAVQAFWEIVFTPAPYTDQWIAMKDELPPMLSSMPYALSVIEADKSYEEAEAIAMAAYEAVQSGQRVNIVSADRTLMRQLSHHLEAYNLPYYDSAATPLRFSSTALFAQKWLEYHQKTDNLSLYALLSHPFWGIIAGRKEHLRYLRTFEQEALRVVIGDALWKYDGDNPDYAQWLQSIQAILTPPPLGKHPLKIWAEWHISGLAAAMGFEGEADWSRLPGQNSGDHKVFLKLEELQKHSQNQLPLDEVDYAELWTAWIAQDKQIRIDQDKAAPIAMIGPQEAASIHAEMVIFAGLNEGSWPNANMEDMWLNRSIRQELGLNLPDKFIGISAHDFILGASAKHWILTRSKNASGRPLVESRFMTRLRVLLAGSDEAYWQACLNRGKRLMDKAQNSLRAKSRDPLSKRFAPKLPNALKKLNISATGLDRLRKTPFEFYARDILHLYELNPIASEYSAMSMGDLYHKGFENFSQKYPPTASIDADKLLQEFIHLLDEREIDGHNRRVFEETIAMMAENFIDDEMDRRQSAEAILVEQSHFADYPSSPPLQFMAKIDRMDIQKDGSYALFDYKSGKGQYSTKTVTLDKSLQLPIAAWIVNKAENADIHALEILKYQEEAGKAVYMDFDLSQFEEGLKHIVEQYLDEDFAFFPTGEGAYSSSYADLARFKEWLLTDEITPIEVYHDEN